jgi:hypothetical protein
VINISYPLKITPIRKPIVQRDKLLLSPLNNIEDIKESGKIKTCRSLSLL